MPSDPVSLKALKDERYENDPPHRYPRIRGRCPSCGAESLFLGSGGYVTCSVIGCKDPAAPHDLLEAHVPSPVSSTGAEQEIQVPPSRGEYYNHPLMPLAERVSREIAAVVNEKPHADIESLLVERIICRALIEASASPRTGSEGWQPIETAPKDETRLLLHAGDWAHPRVGHWFQLFHGEPGIDGWWVEENTLGCSPTHWMPLPSPPAGSASEQK